MRKITVAFTILILGLPTGQDCEAPGEAKVI